ncbi:MAG: hypothetical protein ACWGMT_05300 [Burkholderiales bacterium]
MPFATLFHNVSAMLFGESPLGAADDPDRPIVEAAIEAVVDAVDPRLRLVSGYREKLAPGVRRTIAHMRELGREVPDPVDLSRAAWSANPFIGALFATAEDIPVLLGRSHELTAFFDAAANAGAQEAYALLGMRMEERTVLGAALVGDAVQHDVAQKTVGFVGHRILAVAADALACRREVGARIMRRLAALALQRITARERRANELEERKAILAAQLRLLTLRRGGLQSVAGDAPDESAEIERLERALHATVDDYIETKTNLATLDGTIGIISEVLGAPREHLRLARLHRRVNRMGILVPSGSPEAASDLEFLELALGDGLRAVIAIVRIPRMELPAKADRLKDAARRLI